MRERRSRDTQISGVPALSLASLPVAPLVHKALEFLAILGVAEIFHVVSEFALGGGEPFALFLEPGELGGAPLVESAIAGRARGNALPIICRKTPAAGGPVRAVAPFFSPERNYVARVPGFPLPKFPAEDGEADRPKHDKAQNHRENFHELPRLPRCASTPPRSPGLVRRAWVSGVGTHLSSSRLHPPLRLRRAIGAAALRGAQDICSDCPLSTFGKREFPSYPRSGVRLTRRLPRSFHQV